MKTEPHVQKHESRAQGANNGTLAITDTPDTPALPDKPDVNTQKANALHTCFLPMTLEVVVVG